MTFKGTPHKLVQESRDLTVEAWMVGPLFHGEYKSFYSNGFKQIHAFYNAHRFHGECVEYFQEDGSIQGCYYYVLGDMHGDSYFFKENGNVEKQFWMNSEKHPVPFLPKKPERLPYKSGRTRLDTLEIE